MIHEHGFDVRLMRVEQSVREMQDKAIGKALFSVSAPKPDVSQRVFSSGGGGGGSSGPMPFDIRLRWVVEPQADGTSVSVGYLDVYAPYVEFYLFESEAAQSGKRLIAELITPHGVVESGWYNFAKLSDWPKSSRFNILLDMSMLGANVAWDRSAGYKLYLSDGETDVVLGGGDKPANLYPDSPFVVALADVSTDGVRQLVHGACCISYASANDAALYTMVGSGSDATLTDDFSNVVFTKDSQLWFCTRLMAEVVFHGFSTLHFSLGRPPISQADGRPVFASQIPCALHATDHFDNFIPGAQS